MCFTKDFAYFVNQLNDTKKGSHGNTSWELITIVFFFIFVASKYLMAYT